MSTREAQLRIANLTGSGDVRLAGTTTGLTAPSGYQWRPTQGLVMHVAVNPGGQLARLA